nr:fimbrial protein [Serratia proteamaculans]
MVYDSIGSRIICTGTNPLTYSYSPGISVPEPGLSNVYKTGIAGIGIRVYGSNTRGDTTGRALNNTISFVAGTYAPLAGYRIQLIATNEAGSSGVLRLPTPLAGLRYDTEIATELLLSSASLPVTSIACSLNSTSINVPLGDISATKFTAIGTTAGDKGFDVGLSCDKDAKINVALAGTQNTDTPDTSVLALTSAGQSGTASGVGVQLLYGGTPLKINNNILLKTSAGGKETLPFTARYYQTKTAVGAGLANSSATLNITYQ